MLKLLISLCIALGLTTAAAAEFGGDNFDGLVKGGKKKWSNSSPIKRKIVGYASKHRPGTIIVSTKERRLYHVLGGGKAMRYGIAVGRQGFTWTGTQRVTRKTEWPDWRPPAAMRKREPYLPVHMEGGPENPLGARALYLGSSIYRIHGSNAAWTIGQAVSSGCFRMANDDVVHLYNKVRVGAKVIVR